MRRALQAGGHRFEPCTAHSEAPAQRRRRGCPAARRAIRRALTCSQRLSRSILGLKPGMDAAGIEPAWLHEAP